MQSIRGKPGNNPEEKASFFPGIFPAFLGQKPSNFRISQRQADVVLFFSIQVDSPGWVQGQAAL
ncbi:MAG: hypothetical protein IJP78_10190, partial [Clostridia bacterium]|nr:hypothetical protein [Clostridia bacterium]